VCLAVASASVAACVLTTSLDGLTGGADDAADVPDVIDGDAGIDATIDGGGRDATVDSPVVLPDARPPDVLTPDVRTTDGGCVVSPYTASVLADVPVAYWRLGEAAGATTAKDQTGHYDGTYKPGVTAGVPGVLAGDTAALFDGDAGIVVVGATPAFDGKLPFTLEAWVFPSKIDGVFRGILSNETPTVVNRGGFLLFMHQSTSSDFGFERWANGASNPTIMHEAGVATWSHVVGTFDGATLLFFVNGVKLDEYTNVAVAIPQSYTFVLGALVSGAQPSSFAGRLDEIAVYDHALDPRCVLAHYHLGTSQPP
jgi:hypothetical protein